MNKEECAFEKMALMMEAMQETERQDAMMDELRAAAFEALILHPGSDYRSWSDILCEQYTLEVYDALGEDKDIIRSSLAKLWMEEYQDTASDLVYTYRDWSKAFATPESVQMYYDLVEETKK